MAVSHQGEAMNDRKPLQLRLPPDLKAWLKAEAEKNGASQNSEVIRALRAAMVRTATPDGQNHLHGTFG